MLAQQISQLPGVAQVLVYGSQKFAVRVQVDPVAAAARNISLDDIRTVLDQGQLQHAGRHAVAGRDRNVTLLASGAMRRAADYKNVVVAWRNGAPVRLERDRQRHRQRRERQDRELVQRRPRDRAGDPAPARRQHGRGGRLGQGRAAAVPRAGAGRRSAWRRCSTARSRSATRSHDVQDTLAIAFCARHPGDLPVPALGHGDHHPGAGGADLADRHLRGDVRLRLLDQQHDAAGADAVGRLRGRRRHRHAREHRPPHRGRHAAVRGGAQGLARDRLHHRLDHLLADRGVHPGAADGRHRRPRVPRIRGDDRGRHHRCRASSR